MNSLNILHIFQKVSSPKSKSPCKTSIFLSHALTKRHKFGKKLSTQCKIVVSPIKNSNKTSSVLLDQHAIAKAKITAIKNKTCYNDQIEKLTSVNNPDRKNWQDNGFEHFPNCHILGKGSFGTVVKAKYEGMELAVKIVSKTRKYVLSSLKKEENAINLKHPNIIKVYQVVDTHKNYGLVLMEQWSQTDLQKLINGGTVFSLQQKLRILWNVAQGLQHCHQNKILHLDVKPMNILVRLSDMACKLCDFGSSVDTNLPEEPSPSLLRGTIQYMSPELLRGKLPTCKSDIYSLGITMWQLLNEEIPYLGEDIHTIAYKVVSQNYRPMSVQQNNLVEIYESCWETNPVNRPSTLQFIQQIKKSTHF